LYRSIAHPADRADIVLDMTAEIIPTDEQAATLLRRFRVAEIDVHGVLAARPTDLERLERCREELIAGIGGTGLIRGWPEPPDPYFYVWVFLSVVPELTEYHKSRGIPEDATTEILAELGSQMANRRSMYGSGGLHTYEWMTAHFRGVIYRTGRLLFERITDGEPALGVHIPRGKLTPQLCDESFVAAKEFFATHYPDEPYKYATCTSWVLDPQLEEYLPPDSNIVQFARRFTLEPIGDRRPEDDETVHAIFAKRRTADLPRNTTLERAVLRHLDSGRHWYYRTGRLTL
jgi:hypothetical protein